MNKLSGARQINGSFGSLWLDGEKVLEVTSFEGKVIANREEINQCGSLDVESKITSLKGEGTMKVRKVYSRGIKKLLNAWKEGKDPRSQIIGKLDDPDAFGSERVVINNVWFNELTLMQFEAGQKLEREFPFGFTPSDVETPELI